MKLEINLIVRRLAALLAGGLLCTAGVARAQESDANATASGKHALREYLHKPLLGGPARANLDGVPELVLDPKERVFHAAGALTALAPYCRVELAQSMWRPVTSQDLARLRAQQPARPYAHLQWLDALVHAGGRLAGHLDPGGRYRLKGSALAATGALHHDAIVNRLATPAKLNEIASDSSAPMAAVFDLVSAYAAIGLIDVEGRLSRNAPPPKSGLFSRLRNPFGKN